MSESIELDEKEVLNKKNKDTNFVGGESKIEEREQWDHKLDFLLACVGYAVGFGNVWRFPNLCYENGGGAFLIPYFIFLAVCGMPLFFMELSISQYIGLGPIGCWKAVSPLFQGIGYAMLVISFLICVYYNAILAWVFYYLFGSFRSDVPWRNCENSWNTDACYSGPPVITPGILNKTIIDPATNLTHFQYCEKNYMPVFKDMNMTSLSTVNSTVVNGTITNMTQAVVSNTLEFLKCTYVKPKVRVLPAEEYLNNHVLKQSSGIDVAGEVKWDLALCLLLAWIVVYLCIWKGVKSVGKVVYVTATFPYVVLFILMIRGATLSGAGKGIVYYLKPDFEKLGETQVWVRAASQIFYSLGVGFGSLIAMGSYNKFKNNCLRDAVIVSSINCATSILCGIVVFSVLGHMSEILQLPIEEVAKSGPGLVFIVYPAGISQMPISSLWSVLFFLMLLTIGLDSQFAMMECVISGISDEYPRYLRKYKELFILVMCIVAFLLGIPTVTQAGPYIVEVFNTQAGGVSLLFLAFFESIAIGWIYGADRLLDNVETMIGHRPSIWWHIAWKYISPVIILFIFLYGIIGWDGIKFANYVYPDFAEGIGWMLALMSMVCVPIGVVHYLLKVLRSDSFMPNDSTQNWRSKLREICSPDEIRLKEIENARYEASQTTPILA